MRYIHDEVICIVLLYFNCAPLYYRAAAVRQGNFYLFSRKITKQTTGYERKCKRDKERRIPIEGVDP